jgi:hypothetical protein
LRSASPHRLGKLAYGSHVVADSEIRVEVDDTAYTTTLAHRRHTDAGGE